MVVPKASGDVHFLIELTKAVKQDLHCAVSEKHIWDGNLG